MSKKPAAKFTNRQFAFMNSYVIHRNATQAANEAGYSPKTARQQGQRLLSNVDIRWVREYKKIVPDLSLETAIALLGHQLVEAQLPPDIRDVYPSTLIVRFDSIETYKELDRAKLLHKQTGTKDVHLPSRLSHLPRSTAGVYRELAALVACLQFINNGPAHCSSRVAGKFINISHEMANQHLAAKKRGSA